MAVPASGRGWDADCTHNPTAHIFDGRYYIYYMGNHGNGEYWNHRNNQRIGVAVSDSPTGPFERFDAPLIDVTPGGCDALMTSNPSVARMADRRYIMVYEAVAHGRAAPGRTGCMRGRVRRFAHRAVRKVPRSDIQQPRTQLVGRGSVHMA